MVITMIICCNTTYAQLSRMSHLPTQSTTPPEHDTELSLSSIFKPVNELDSLIGAGSVVYTFFSNGSADTINYLQFCLSSSSSCASCDHYPFNIFTTGNQTSPITITLGGNNYSINSNAIQTYLTQYAKITASATYNIGLYLQSASLNCTSTYCSTSVDLSNNKLCIQATYNGTTTSLTQVDSGEARLNKTTTQFVYVVDSGNNTTPVFKCSINSSALNCTGLTDSSLPSAPWSITFGTAGGTQFAYILQESASDIYRCNIGNGDLSGCTSVGSTALAGANPFQMAITTVNQSAYAYVATGTSVVQCPLNSDGTLGTCVGLSNIPGAGDFEGIAFLTTKNGNQYAYLADQNSTVYKCPVTVGGSHNGDFSSCPEANNDSSLGISGAQSIAVAKVNKSQYAYIGALGGTGNKDSWICKVDPSTGYLNNCSASPGSQPTDWGITGQTVVLESGSAGPQYLYLTSELPNDLYVMQIASDGSLGTPSTTGGQTFSALTSVGSVYIPSS